MFNISSFLGKFKSRELEQIKKYDIVMRLVKKHCNIDVTIQQIRFDHGRINLSIPSIEKNEVMIKKNALLEALRAELSPYKVSDIV